MALALKSGVAKAVDGLRNHFPDNRVEVCAMPDGAAFVVLEDVLLGPPYKHASTWVGFYLSTGCPDDDTYPFYVRGDLARLDGAELKPPIHKDRSFPEVDAPMVKRPAFMVSRRQKNQASFPHETPLLKLLTVLKWLLEQ